MAVVAVLLIHMERKAVGNMNPNIRNLPVISHRITFNLVIIHYQENLLKNIMSSQLLVSFKHTLIKKENQISSYIRKFRVEHLQSHI